MFLAASAFSDTGLTPISIAYSFNMFGQALIAISVLVGGLGIFTLKVYILQTIFGSKINVFNSALTQIERGSADGG
ncbi:potassium uptake B domain protein, partial [Chlamydia psittaci 02DC14]